MCPQTNAENIAMTENSENIFLFWRNLMGTWIHLFNFMKSNVQKWILTLVPRVSANHPRFRISVLHAPPSTNLLCSLQCFMSAQCYRWLCSTAFRSKKTIWNGSRHGHGSLYHYLSACIFGKRLEELRAGLSSPHIVGSGEPLLSNVCDTGNGWWGQP